jgi:hypothetical protein
MTAAEETEMKRLIEELGTQFCRRCDYCQPCAQGIPISMVMTFDTMIKRLPPDWYLKNPMMSQSVEKAANCTECGECESRCPFGLPIREILKRNYTLYEKVKAENS